MDEASRSMEWHQTPKHARLSASLPLLTRTACQRAVSIARKTSHITVATLSPKPQLATQISSRISNMALIRLTRRNKNSNTTQLLGKLTKLGTHLGPHPSSYPSLRATSLELARTLAEAGSKSRWLQQSKGGPVPIAAFKTMTSPPSKSMNLTLR